MWFHATQCLFPGRDERHQSGCEQDRDRVRVDGSDDRLNLRPGPARTLADASTYDGAPVAVHETHSSWVFVSGDSAFKLKKPLDLGFLDYSTLARRHSACAEEVRVNRELAPGIYRGVRAIVKTDTGFAFAPEKAPGSVDYVVEMRRFREADTIAGLIASAGSRAPTSTQSRVAWLAFTAMHLSWPGARGRRWVRGRRTSWSSRRRLAPRGPVNVAAGFAEHSSGTRRRDRAAQAAGLIRDGHGDLRCEHVLAVPNVRIVDRIEFDPSLRHSDIACDLAFLAMDLEALGGAGPRRSSCSAYGAPAWTRAARHCCASTRPTTPWSERRSR